ncbi:MAG: SigE family RNA polymerase sigma factor [Micromonosporaceae bacterium]
MDPEASFGEYVAARHGFLVRVAYLLTGDRHAAEDLVQLALVRVARHWERVIAGGDPDPYVRRVLYRQHVSQWRRRWRHVELRPEPPVPASGPPDPAGAVTTSLLVRQALARLAPRQRAVLVLRYFEDLTEVATAEALGCSVSTLKGR